jgi:hypothetical protein
MQQRQNSMSDGSKEPSQSQNGGSCLKTIVAVGLFVIGASTLALATPPAPEIDPASGTSAIALIAGALLVIRGRRKN